MLGMHEFVHSVMLLLAHIGLLCAQYVPLETKYSNVSDQPNLRISFLLQKLIVALLVKKFHVCFKKLHRPLYITIRLTTLHSVTNLCFNIIFPEGRRWGDKAVKNLSPPTFHFSFTCRL